MAWPETAIFLWGTRTKLLIQTFQIHLLLLLLDTDSLVTMKTLVLCWFQVIRRPAQLSTLDLPGLSRLHHNWRQSFGQLGVLLTWVWEGLVRQLGTCPSKPSPEMHIQSKQSTCSVLASFLLLTCTPKSIKNPLQTGAGQPSCTGRISKVPKSSSLPAWMQRGYRSQHILLCTYCPFLGKEPTLLASVTSRQSPWLVWSDMHSKNGNLGDKIHYVAKHWCFSSGGSLGHKGRCCNTMLNGCCSPSSCCPFTLIWYSCFLAVTVY